jgi:hypothetical protein
MHSRIAAHFRLSLVLGALALLLPVRAAAQAKPYSLDQVATLLRGGVSQSYILDQVRPNCVSFRVDEAAVTVLRESGADEAFVSSLRQVCYQSPGGGTDSTATVPLIYRPATAALLSVIPGGGQFYTHRPLLGAGFLAAAAAAVAVGMQREDLTVECLAHNVGGSCPPDQRGRTVASKRPDLIPAIGAAAALGVISGIVGFTTAARVNRQAAGNSAKEEDTALRVEAPVITVAGAGIRLEAIRLRF